MNNPEQKILASWQKNARPWVDAVRGNEIDSRVTVTNQAIIDAILQRSPDRVLDIGCGEGWLVRELQQRHINCYGIDAVPELIDRARDTGIGEFRQMEYTSLGSHSFDTAFDLLVCNFSLLGKSSVQHLFQQAAGLLNAGGALMVQTLHPLAACGKHAYEDGWRDGSWDGFNPAFTDPAPWYFRTLESWQSLFSDNGFSLLPILEPRLSPNHQPASVVLIGEVTA